MNEENKNQKEEMVEEKSSKQSTPPAPAASTSTKKMAESESKKSKWYKKWYVWLVVAIFLFIALSCWGCTTILNKVPSDITKKEDTTTKEDISESVENEKKEKVIISEPSKINLSDVGKRASKKFILEKGLSIFRMTHDGSSNFSIQLLDQNGSYVELLVNEIGDYKGSTAVGVINKGEYIMDISADGYWTVEIEQPRSRNIKKQGEMFSGTGETATELFLLDDGLNTFEMTHDGSSNFAVTLLDEDGNYIELLINELGIFEGSKAVGIKKEGIFIMKVNADGNWAINIK